MQHPPHAHANRMRKLRQHAPGRTLPFETAMAASVSWPSPTKMLIGTGMPLDGLTQLTMESRVKSTSNQARSLARR